MPSSISLSPLRYPGGKALLSGYIADVLEKHLLIGCNFYEPYLGGASVSLELLKQRRISKAIWVERDPLIFAFWHSVLNNHDGLIKGIKALDVSINTWEAFQCYREVTDPFDTQCELLQLGIAGLFFNRTNFSGILGAGPIGGRKQTSRYDISCRFNKARVIAQINEVSLYRDEIWLNYGDALEFMHRNSKQLSTGFNFIYIDPPYYAQGGKLYRYFYEDRNHLELALFIKEQGYPWLISYDDHERIKELYAENEIQPIYLDYKAKSSRRAKELLISNIEIPPPIYVKGYEIEDSVIENSIVVSHN